jgi:hypothetical protein
MQQHESDIHITAKQVAEMGNRRELSARSKRISAAIPVSAETVKEIVDDFVKHHPEAASGPEGIRTEVQVDIGFPISTPPNW